MINSGKCRSDGPSSRMMLFFIVVHFVIGCDLSRSLVGNLFVELFVTDKHRQALMIISLFSVFGKSKSEMDIT